MDPDDPPLRTEDEDGVFPPLPPSKGCTTRLKLQQITGEDEVNRDLLLTK